MRPIVRRALDFGLEFEIGYRLVSILLTLILFIHLSFSGIQQYLGNYEPSLIFKYSTQTNKISVQLHVFIFIYSYGCECGSHAANFITTR